jgi:hypothetical protein
MWGASIESFLSVCLVLFDALQSEFYVQFSLAIREQIKVKVWVFSL